MTTRRSSQRVFPSPDPKHKRTSAVIPEPEPQPETEQAVAELPPPPSSPVRSMIAAFNKAVAAAPEAEVVKQIVEERGKQAYAEADRALINARTVRSRPVVLADCHNPELHSPTSSSPTPRISQLSLSLPNFCSLSILSFRGLTTTYVDDWSELKCANSHRSLCLPLTRSRSTRLTVPTTMAPFLLSATPRAPH